MKQWIVIGLFAAFVTLAAASAEARGRPSHHHSPHHRSHVSFSFGCWPRYRPSYFGAGYARRGWSVGLSCWPSYRSYYYVPTYPVVYSSAPQHLLLRLHLSDLRHELSRDDGDLSDHLHLVPRPRAAAATAAPDGAGLVPPDLRLLVSVPRLPEDVAGQPLLPV